MADRRCIAAAQTVPARGDVAGNIEEHLRLARLAADEGAQVLVFPELSLTGYELDLAAALEFTERDARLDTLRELASDRDLTLVVGAPVRIGARRHLGALVLTPDGELDVYTKHYLGAFSQDVNPGGSVPPPEGSVFEPGDRNPLVQLPGQDASGASTAALAVCADVNRPAHVEAAVARGARCLLAAMFVVPAEYERDAERLAGYAARHAMPVALANFGGPTGGLAAAGRSAIWSETGELLARLESAGSGIVVATEGGSTWRARAIERPGG